MELVLANNEFISLAIASHNVRSIAKSLVLVEQLDVPKSRSSSRHSTGWPNRSNTLSERWATRFEYAPVGELIPGMAYLVRRLLENTSNEGFLRRKLVGNASPDVLLAEPEAWVEVIAPGEIPGHATFVNEPILDFAVEANRTAMRDAVAKVRREMGKVFPVIYGGKAYETREKLVSVNPHDPGEVVCGTSALTREMGGEALTAARTAQSEWGRRTPEERAAYFFKAAAIARKRRLELAAWEVLDVGKNWAEADADVCEAIDFLEYYGREMIRLGKPLEMGHAPGESNVYFLSTPRGGAGRRSLELPAGHFHGDGFPLRS